MIDGFNAAEWWLKLKRGEEPFDYSCFSIPALCDHKRSPRYLDGRVFDEKVQTYFEEEQLQRQNLFVGNQVQCPYAYHFDAHLLAEFLKDYAMTRGVHQVLDDVVGVNRKEDGSIASIETKEHGAIEG